MLARVSKRWKEPYLVVVAVWLRLLNLCSGLVRTCQWTLPEIDQPLSRNIRQHSTLMVGYLAIVKNYSNVDTESPQNLADGLDKASSDIGAMGLLIDQASQFRRSIHVNSRHSH
jgi:hypothetical protein